MWAGLPGSFDLLLDLRKCVTGPPWYLTADTNLDYLSGSAGGPRRFWLTKIYLNLMFRTAIARGTCRANQNKTLYLLPRRVIKRKNGIHAIHYLPSISGHEHFKGIVRGR